MVLFPDIDKDKVVESVNLIPNNSDKSQILDVFKFLGIRACDFVSRYYGAALKRADHVKMLSFIKSNLHKESLLVYRAVLLPVNAEDLANMTSRNKHGIGKYWTFDINKAEAYDCIHTDQLSSQNVIVLEAEVKWSDINWGATLTKSLYHNSSEHEIELHPSSTPLLVSSMSYHQDVVNQRLNMYNNYKNNNNNITPEIKSKFDMVGDFIRIPVAQPDYVSIGHNLNRIDELD